MQLLVLIIYHEILFIYLADFINAEDKQIEYSLDNAEGNDFLKYKWLDINSLDSQPIFPSCIKDLFRLHGADIIRA